ncbi:hypothetical protein [Kitasatospora sp. NPDC086791]|uniref:hypothetical protein n=1 Tax=Kitasatospora sp. NPDC086791 TaxID=3155178 RepID=UPI00343A8412
MTITVPAGAQAPAAGRRKKPAVALTGPDRIPRPSQGWYRNPVTGDKLRRVTTILDQGEPNPALMFWSANHTARLAIDSLPRLLANSRTSEEREESYDWLRKGHVRMKDERADVGGAVHRVIESTILGTPMPMDIVNDPELAAYLRHFQAFVRDWEIVFEASEMVVANPDEGYAGTLDFLFYSRLIARLLGVPSETLFKGDTKTGGELDKKGVYPKAALQMAAYRRAQVCWLRSGEQIPMPAVHSTGIVLHLRPEGYRVIPLECGDAVFDAFLQVKKVADWTSGLSKTVIGSALQLPTLDTTKAAA